jgi:hypothetical protein
MRIVALLTILTNSCPVQLQHALHSHGIVFSYANHRHLLAEQQQMQDVILQRALWESSEWVKETTSYASH